MTADSRVDTDYLRRQAGASVFGIPDQSERDKIREAADEIDRGRVERDVLRREVEFQTSRAERAEVEGMRLREVVRSVARRACEHAKDGTCPEVAATHAMDVENWCDPCHARAVLMGH